MAPVYNHHLPPRPAQGPPGEARPVHSVFGIKIFLSLFIATFCIFVAAVFCWKFGAFLRLFTRHRVIGGGADASIRYAKTWYGWIPLERHRRYQQLRREWFRTARNMIAWRPTHADYTWVWWDPGPGSGKGERNQEGRPSHSFPPSLDGDGFHTETCTETARKLLRDGLAVDVTLKHPTGLDGVQCVFADPCSSAAGNSKEKAERPVAQHIDASHCSTQCRQFEANIPVSPASGGLISDESRPIKFPLLPPRVPRTDGDRSAASPSRPHGRSCTSEKLQRNQLALWMHFAPEAPQDGHGQTTVNALGTEGSISGKNDEGFLSGRYKAWGARMQRTTFPDTPVQLRGFAGRPGTPRTDTLRSLVSTLTNSEFSRRSETCHLQRRAASDSSLAGTCSRPKQYFSTSSFNIGGRSTARDCLTEGFLSQSSLQGSQGDERTGSGQLVLNRKFPTRSRNRSRFAFSHLHRTFPQRRISNPEVRLIDDLERKLEWFSSETDPGRRLYHYSIQYNHWLNKATWVAYDSASRVPSSERRLYGDPRCNYPHPDTPKKLLVQGQRNVAPKPRAIAPKIDSWRKAVNGARKSAGVREFLKAVELFEGSAEEPPDGAIDTATWVLRKPPQGFEMSTKQRNAYFEGCGGWFEKLDYWQNVPRAYRARRVICEGGVNRRRVAELARGLTGDRNKDARNTAHHAPRRDSNQGKAPNKNTGKVAKLRWNSNSASQSRNRHDVRC